MSRRKTAIENIEIAAEWFFGAFAGYVMLRGVDVARDVRRRREADIPQSVRVTIAPPSPQGTPGFVGPSGDVGAEGQVFDAEFVDDDDYRESNGR